MCTFETLQAGRALPLVVRPQVPGLDLAAWIANHRDSVRERLVEHGGMLFRGFGLTGAAELEACVKALSGELLDYVYRSTPRTRVAGKIFTSTTYPPSLPIPMHNEMSYSRNWPLKLWFLSVIPARSGGRTPIADSRRVYERIPAAVRAEFIARGVMYVRNYGEGVDLPWQEVFQTDDKNEIERFCRSAGIEFEWRTGDALTTRQVCQAAATHPQTGETVWFNQAHLFHVSSLDPTARRVLLDRFTEDELPRHAYYGDGGAIDPGSLDEIRAAYEAEMVRFTWEQGDVLLLDNMLTAHGREAFDGPRQVLAGMAERAGAGGVCVEL
jgi:alpha-ketoglutarate-dependent taurine dioxygenase